ncbi:uncharacterized protein LOC143254195 [Tachypleus tridentatus]|uniref:uncharacterized protein LOC143254195 n=1 Tax=Tachypleus tridentatus TaxID=6853 RepID=UPI003FD1AE60
MKMKSVNFILLLVITVYYAESYAENGVNRITRNIHNGYRGHGYIGGSSRALNRLKNKSGFDKKQDFGICNRNGRYKKYVFRRITYVCLVFDSYPNLRDGLRRETRTVRHLHSGAGRRSDIRLDSELRMNDSLHLNA